MDIKPFLLEVRNDVQCYFRTLRPVFRQYSRPLLALAVLGAGAAFLLWPYDQIVYRCLLEIRREPWIEVARFFREWGAFCDIVIITLSIFSAGCIWKKRNWRKLAVAFFLTACLAGIAVNMLRFTTGRPRPHEEVPDRFHGMAIYSRKYRPEGTSIYDYQSFPSGHSGTALGGAAMLMVVAPPLGVPAMISAGGVVWSSVYNRKHYVTDVLCGSVIGIIFGIAGGAAFRRMN